MGEGGPTVSYPPPYKCEIKAMGKPKFAFKSLEFRGTKWINFKE
jgi:hypothetical protein